MHRAAEGVLSVTAVLTAHSEGPSRHRQQRPAATAGPAGAAQQAQVPVPNALVPGVQGDRCGGQRQGRGRQVDYRGPTSPWHWRPSV